MRIPIIYQIHKMIKRLWFRQDVIKLDNCAFWSWCDTTEKVEIALIKMLFEYVEKDSASMYYEGWIPIYLLSQETRSELGMQWLLFQMDPDPNSLCGYYIKDNLDEKILDLYIWFKNEYSHYKELASEEFTDLTNTFLIDSKLKEIVDCRHRMWT